MTEQGRLVFINAIHYISKFKGQQPLSPKLAGTMWLQDRVKDKHSKDYRKDYEDYSGFIKEINEREAKAKAKAKAKKDKGEELTDMEKYSLTSRPKSLLSIEEYLGRYEPRLYPKFGTNLKKYSEYYKTYSAYMRADSENLRNFIIDKDAMKLGKSFNEPDFLEICLKALKDDSKKDLAFTLLKRYTMESFDSAKEWERWHKKNKSKLFFTETGGCKYIVNTLK